MSPAEKKRFWPKVEKTGTCWLWTSALGGGGYPLLTVKRNGKWTTRAAHRLAYEELVGPISEGMTIDHLCRVRRCVNPAHLEEVTRGENVLRGDTLSARNLAKTHCKNGHEFTDENTIRRPSRPSHRECRTCNRAADRRRRKAAA